MSGASAWAQSHSSPPSWRRSASPPAALGGFNPFGSEEVGQTYNGALLLPTNQWISPIGTRIEDHERADRVEHAQPRRPVHGCADVERVHRLPDDLRPEDGQDRSGRRRLPQHSRPRGRRTRRRGGGRRPAYSPDGKTLWVPQTGDIAKFTVDPETGMVSEKVIIEMPKAANGPAPENSTEATHPGEAEPSGMALSPDGSKLYVAFNGSNTLGVINTSTNEVEKEIPVGNAPRQSSSTATPPTSPTRAAIPRSRAKRPTSPTAPRSSRARSPELPRPARSRSSNLTTASRNRKSPSDSSRPRCTRADRRCSSPTPTTTASR